MVTYNKGPRQSPFRPRGSGVGNDKGRKVGAKGKKARVTMDAEYQRKKALTKRVLSLDRRVKVKALLVYDDCVYMMIVCI